MKALLQTDITIVGSGSCGALVARELAQRGMSVIVLEAGQRFGANHPSVSSDPVLLRVLRVSARKRSLTDPGELPESLAEGEDVNIQN